MPGARASSSTLAARMRAHAAEVAQEVLAPGRADAGDVVERRRQHPLAAAGAVEAVGDAVRLVADAGQHVQLGRARPQGDGVLDAAPEHAVGRGAVGQVTLLGQADDVDAPLAVEIEPEVGQRRHRAGQLALAAVDHHQVGRGPRVVGVGRLGRPLEAAPDHLVHRREVVVAGGPDLERAVAARAPGRRRRR
jgi:hypothetical protein